MGWSESYIEISAVYDLHSTQQWLLIDFNFPTLFSNSVNITKNHRCH